MTYLKSPVYRLLKSAQIGCKKSSISLFASMLYLLTTLMAFPSNADACTVNSPSTCSNRIVCGGATKYSPSSKRRNWFNSSDYAASMYGEARKRRLTCGVGLDAPFLKPAMWNTKEFSYYSDCGTTKSDVEELQSLLQSLDLYPYKIDGLPGSGTLKAIQDGKRLLGAQASNGKCLSQKDVIALRLLSNNASLGDDYISANNDNSDTALNELSAQNEKLISENEALRGRVAILTATIAELSGSNTSNEPKPILDFENTVAQLSDKLRETENLLEAEQLKSKQFKQKSERVRETLENLLAVLDQEVTQNESNSSPLIQSDNEVTNPVNEENTNGQKALVAKGVLSTAVSDFTEDAAVRCYVGLRIIDRSGYRNAEILDVYLIKNEETNSYIFSDFEMIRSLEIEPENFIFQVIDTSPDNSQEQSCSIVSDDPIKVVEQSAVHSSTPAAYLRADGILIFTNFPVRPI